MNKLGLQDSQQITKSEEVIPPSLQARTTQDLSHASCARVALQDPTPSIPQAFPVHRIPTRLGTVPLTAQEEDVRITPGCCSTERIRNR